MNFSPIIVMAQEVLGKQSLNELHKGQGWIVAAQLLEHLEHDPGQCFVPYIYEICGIFLTKS